jgi:hypothetical protein
MKYWNSEEIHYLIENYGTTPNPILSDYLGKSRQAVSLKAGRLGLKKSIIIRSHERRSIIYSLNQRAFINITPDICYVVGFILADGCIGTNRMKISNTNYFILDKIRNVLGSNHPIKQEHNNFGKWHSLTICSMNIRDDLFMLGINPRKSLNAVLPNIPDEHFSHFLRGYFDGDGGVYYSKRSGLRIKFTSGSKKLLVETKQRIKKLYKINGSDVVCDSGRKNAFRLWYYGSKAEDMANIMYKDSNDLFIERKHNVFKSYHNLSSL